ncbi:helix-turn-helix domain-containing protein [Saccharothrix syringae]|uniref:XRE family transcriptional regulator n=1 Tax=Saccharothrix syringae TaxID=103733 RepID=A0A5Q0GU83_SACSY|nr:helix-turn-helix transcriptional regulator [Saccharothrix syringae]QFZ17185.1 XRE family transcriptional regulator [Saccharothrix syringae]
MQTDEKQSTRLSTARSRELGEELRRVRHRAGMSSGLVTEALGWSLGKLSKLETGTRGTSPWEIGTLLGRCGADKATRERIMAIANEPDTGSFLRRHATAADDLLAVALHEGVARAIATYEPITVPSLAQTEDYARALTGDHDLAGARVARQENLNRADGPDTVVYVHEIALRLVVGDVGVMRDQVLHLTALCGRPRYGPRVIPMTAAAHAALRHPATVLTFNAPFKPLVYTETDAATVFHDDPTTVTVYQAKMRRLHRLALDAERSRDLLARWAEVYDRETR